MARSGTRFDSFGAQFDWLSTVELLWLGESLQTLQCVDPGWLGHHVREAKREDKSVRVGSQFEILGLAALSGPDQVLLPAAQAMPAYDADVTVRDNPLRLSLKNFGALQRQRVFEARAASVEQSVLSWAQARGHAWIGLLVVAQRYPTEDDWSMLHAALPQFLEVATPLLELGVWRVVRHLPGPTIGTLDDQQTSCNITVLGAQHHNERWAFLSRLQREFGAFNIAAAAWPDREKAVLVRLAERAPISEAACGMLALAGRGSQRSMCSDDLYSYALSWSAIATLTSTAPRSTASANRHPTDVSW
jgi:hypothetical protein